MKPRKLSLRHLITGIGLAALVGLAGPVSAAVHQVTMTAMEHDVEIDNAGTKYPAWTFGEHIPGPVIRVKEGDTVEFKLINPESNKNSHSMDFHAAVADVLGEFATVRPGETKEFTFQANHPGVFMYHCGADPMHQHIARGMYGVIIVDPKEGYSEAYPKPDREYVIVQGDLFAEGTPADDMALGNGWKASLINGKVFHYDPVHDANASLVLEARPGERVRIFYVNASLNEAAAMHPIAGIWDRVWDNGNPKNISYGLQTVDVAPAHGMVMDIVPPADRPTNNAIVDHRMKHAMNGAITVLMTHKDANPDAGRGDQLILR